eukprot:6963633-Ditylum_brightwellii.AAC.1
MSNQTFHDKFKAIVSVVKEHGGNIALHTSLIELEQAEYGGDEEDDEEGALDTEELEEHLAHCFLKKACKVRYESLLEGLHTSYLMGRCAYPDTVNAAYDLINGYQDKAMQHTVGYNVNGALSFNTVGREDGKEEGDDI